MNIKSYFTEIWQEKYWWKSILLTGIIAMIPIVGWIYLLGWLFEIYRWNHTPKGTHLPFLPTFDIFKNGLFLTIGLLIYAIPFLLLAAMISGLRGVFTLADVNWLTDLLVKLFSFLVKLTLLTGILAVMFVLPALIIVYEQNTQIGDFFKINQIIKSVTQNIQTLSTFFVLSILAVFIGSIGGSFLMIGFIFTVPFAAAFYANALGDLNLITVS